VADEEGIAVVPREHCEMVAASLRTYQPRRSLQDWDTAALEVTMQERQDYFQEIFEKSGGASLEWPG
jgi:hypothetical protein